MNDLDVLKRRLRDLSNPQQAAFQIVEGLADAWINESKRRAPVDTGQLKARTTVVSVRASGRTANADVQSDVPYAGYQEFGTRYVAPNPYFRDGRDHAARVGNGLGGRMETQLRRSLDSGGVWNPRSLF